MGPQGQVPCLLLLAHVPTRLPSGQTYSANAAKEDIIPEGKQGKICLLYCGMFSVATSRASGW